MTSSASEPEKPTRRVSVTLARVCGLILAVFALLYGGSWIYFAFHSSVLGAFRDVDHLAVFIANLLVVLFAFPAFRRTRDRAFLCLAAAGLFFAYSPLYSMLFGVGSHGPTDWHMSRAQAYWYYVARRAADLVGLVLYAGGVVSLARRTKPKA